MNNFNKKIIITIISVFSILLIPQFILFAATYALSGCANQWYAETRQNSSDNRYWAVCQPKDAQEFMNWNTTYNQHIKKALLAGTGLIKKSKTSNDPSKGQYFSKNYLCQAYGNKWINPETGEKGFLACNNGGGTGSTVVTQEDSCVNISGLQIQIPEGYMDSGGGVCVPIPDFEIECVSQNKNPDAGESVSFTGSLKGLDNDVNEAHYVWIIKYKGQEIYRYEGDTTSAYPYNRFFGIKRIFDQIGEYSVEVEVRSKDKLKTTKDVCIVNVGGVAISEDKTNIDIDETELPSFNLSPCQPAKNPIAPGEEVIFSVMPSGNITGDVEYIWKDSSGKILAVNDSTYYNILDLDNFGVSNLSKSYNPICTKAELFKAPSINAGSLVEGFNLNEEVHHYSIYGSSKEDIMNELFECAPGDASFATFAAINSKHHISYLFEQKNDICSLSDVKVGLNLSITMPNWEQPSTATAETVSFWKTLYKNLWDHENIHRNNRVGEMEMINDYLNNFQKSGSCSDAGSIIDDNIEKVLTEFDKRDELLDSSAKKSYFQFSSDTPGVHEITVMATDDSGASDEFTCSVTVLEELTEGSSIRVSFFFDENQNGILDSNEQFLKSSSLSGNCGGVVADITGEIRRDLTCRNTADPGNCDPVEAFVVSDLGSNQCLNGERPILKYDFSTTTYRYYVGIDTKSLNNSGWEETTKMIKKQSGNYEEILDSIPLSDEEYRNADVLIGVYNKDFIYDETPFSISLSCNHPSGPYEATPINNEGGNIAYVWKDQVGTALKTEVTTGKSTYVPDQNFSEAYQLIVTAIDSSGDTYSKSCIYTPSENQETPTVSLIGGGLTNSVCSLSWTTTGVDDCYLVNRSEIKEPVNKNGSLDVSPGLYQLRCSENNEITKVINSDWVQCRQNFSVIEI
jgi:predicted secreted Zn-dependent protease